MSGAVESEGATIDEAIERALAEIGAAREDVRVEILRDARRGLFGFGGQRARVRVSRREEIRGVEVDRAVEPAAREIAAPAVEGSPRSVEIVRELLRLMSVPAAISTTSEEDGSVLVRIESDTGGLLIGKHGQTLDALEYLVNRMSGRREDGEAAIVLDAERYRERRRESLEQMARALAAKVKERGRAETLAPMSARDRRIVHVALRSEPAVTTRSLGGGHLRRIVIAPAAKAGRS